jgi:hypothetical protein
MSTTKTSIVLKDLPKSGTLECANLYVMNTTVFYAAVHTPKNKYQSTDKEFSAILFVDEATKDKLLDEVMVNKTFLLVGKDKTSKPPRRIKYPLSTQVEEGKVNYDIVDGMYGFGVAKNELSKKGNPMVVNVIDKEGKSFSEDIGNGSVCNVKLFGYKNQDDQLVVSIDTVQVIKHIPYEGGTGVSSGVVEDDVFGVSYTLQKAEESVAEDDVPKDSQATPQKKQVVEDDFDELLPF